MSDSIWKKDISFGRKRKLDDLPETPDSVRVKQLAFQQKLAQAAGAPAAPEPPNAEPAPEPSTSVWKKDLSFRRKSAEEQPILEVVLPAVPPAPVAAADPVAFEAPAEIELPDLSAPAPTLRASAPEPDSIWKKEISFRRKPQEEGSAAPDGAPAEPPVSIWKKEITFRRKHDDDGEKSDSIWHKEISFRRRQEWNKEIEALAEEALRDVDAAAAVATGPKAETWLAKPELPPEPLPDAAAAPAPAPIAPMPAPAPVAAAPVAAAPEVPVVETPKTSIWKRELGGSKKKKAKEPKAEKPAEPKAPKAKKSRTRLRDLKVSMPKPQAKSHGGHQVKRLVGLKIGASQLAAARVANNGAAELIQIARQPLEQGVVVGGEVRDPEALALALKQFFAKNKLPRKNVRLGIASNRIGVRIFDLVGIDDDKQLENAIRFRAQETLPIPLDEAVLDYHVLGESVDEEGATVQRVLLVVAYRELVDRYVSACKRAGISLAGVDLEAFALLRSLAAPPAEEVASDSALVAVAIGHDRSTFAVSDGRICEFTRVIEWGGSTLSVAIARALDLAPSEVEQTKKLVSLESPDVPEGMSPEQYGLAVDAVRRQVQAFARELVSSLQFYQHQPGSLGIGEIVITGGTAGLVGLAAELQSLIGVRVRVGDPLARLKVPKKLAVDDDLGSYAIAIGLGIED
jgi:type IV pilus assembly protein PilM